MLSFALAVVVSASAVEAGRPASGAIEQQIHQRRLEQISELLRIITLSGREPELLFRMGDLWLEESRALLLEGDERGSAAATKHAISFLAAVAQEHPSWARADETLYLLGKALLESNDDRRAMLAFRRLIDRHAGSRYVADAHFARGEHLFAKSNGRREWLRRALAEYAAASGPDALYKQGWCLLNLADFEGAMAKFREVASLGGVRASDAERDFVRAFEKGGGKLADFSPPGARRRALTEWLAKLYRDDGFDGEAALTFQALIRERPRAKEALGFQQEVIEALLRMGKKPLVVAQVQRLVVMASEIEGDVSSAEPMLAKLATSWHAECRKTKEEHCLALPSAIYDAYLALFSAAPRAYELRFFHAELLFEVGDFSRAATAYRSVVDRDIECRNTQQCEAGKFLEPAAWGEIQAREALAMAPHQGGLGRELEYFVSR